MVELSRQAMARILTKAGAKRVSPKAAQKLAQLLEEHGIELARQAVQKAHFSGRVTIKEEDL